MIGDDHQVSYLEVVVDTAGGVGHEQVLDSDDLHHADRKRDKFHRVAFVEVDSSLHGDDRLAAQLAHDEVALVAYRRGDRESRDCLVRYCQRIAYAVRKFSKAAAKHDADFRFEVANLLSDIFSGSVDSFCSWIHIFIFINYRIASAAGYCL